MKYLFTAICLFDLISCHNSCKREGDTETSIYITDDIIIKDKVKARDSIFNYDYYEKFLQKLISTNRYIFVPLSEFDTTYSSEKIVIGIRHDIDYDISSAVRFARREYRNGIRAVYYFLNTADYYGIAKRDTIIRNPSVLAYMKKIQNEYNHEIGWHNDLVTCQIVYNLDIKKYLSKELAWLDSNGIRISGSSYHGSEYCYTYKYVNTYIWKGFIKNYNFENYDSVFFDGYYVRIIKFNYTDFGFKYEAEQLNPTYFFADVFYIDNKRWNMTMFDWDSLKPGDRVIILTHPALWD